MFKPLVLIVDDDVNILRVMRKKLSDAGYDIIEAKNGIESIEQATKYSPKIIVMDISMPKLDGIGAILKMKTLDKTRSIPIIVWTGIKEQEDEVIAQELGVVDYVRKDNFPDLIEKIKKTLNK